MIIGDLTKEELKIAKSFEKKLKKRDYQDITIKKDTFITGLFIVAGIEPLGKRVVSVRMNITDMKTKF